ncbi:hypothetical protein ABPG72_018242 [Tetrahymena utriculariae]
MSQWYDIFYFVASMCPVGQIILHIIQIAQFVPKQNDALDYIGNTYKMQIIKENTQGQTYNNYLIVKQNATITNIDSSSCHLYSSFSDADYDLNFVNTFLSQDSQLYHDRSRNVFTSLALVYYSISAIQIFFLVVICFYYFSKNQEKEKKRVCTFFENSSSIVNYYLGTFLMPINGIDYNSDCLQNQFTILGINPLFPYYFSIAMIILLPIILAFFSYYQVPVPYFLIISLPLLAQQCDNKKNDGCCYLLIIIFIVLTILIFYPTVYSINNNQFSFTFIGFLSFIISMLSGVKDTFSD